MAKITELQQEFIKQLYGACAGDMKKAAAAVGVEDYSMLMTDEVIEAIKKRADNELVFNVPKAVSVMSKILDNPESVLYFDKLHKVAADVLDRAGLSKVDRSVQGSTAIGLVFLPDLKPTPEPPEDETEQPASPPPAI